MRIIAPNTTIDPTKVASVMEEMKRLGAPVLRAIMIDDKILAIEGSHRLAAAQTLGLPVKLPGWACLNDVGLEHYLFGIEGMIRAGLDRNLVSFDVDVVDEQEATA
jgi:hypothetical protein